VAIQGVLCWYIILYHFDTYLDLFEVESDHFILD
jgi:hypothetical protein